MIERQLKQKALKLLNHFPAIAILGARQVGKTTLVKMLKNDLSKPSIYLDLENPSDLAVLENALPFFRANQDKCLIIDEIQRRADLFPVLRSMIDEHRVSARFILSGSANPALLKLTSETLAGRIVYLELFPFNYYEIRHIASINKHWLTGGFPQPFLIEDDDIRNEWFNSFIMTYIERDLPMLGLTSSPQHLMRFITMLAHSQGRFLNKSTFAKALELSVPTITKYLNYLENSFIIRLLQPFYLNIKKRLVKSPKIYIRDSGILHYLLKIKDYNALLGHPIVGHSWEGYIIEQIISILGNDYEYFYFRTQDGAECDLVITEGFQPYATVEIKFTSTPKKTKSLNVAIKNIGVHNNFIIIPECKHSYLLDENLTVCDLNSFFEIFPTN